MAHKRVLGELGARRIFWMKDVEEVRRKIKAPVIGRGFVV